MADKKTSDAEFDAYLDGKSPLSELYQRSETGGPGKDIDNAILSAARQEVQKHASGSSTRGYRWYVPMALAASLVIALMVVRVGPFDNAPGPDQIAENETVTTPGQHVGSAKTAPEIRLQKISELVANGEQKQAQQEYELFIELFPKYEVDFKKYPNIRSLAGK